MFSPSNTLFISWIGYHGRSQGIADALGVRSEYISADASNLISRYRKNWALTKKFLAEAPEDNVIIMLPPAVALFAVVASRPRSRGVIVGDLHTGVFTDPKWRWLLGRTLRVLRRRGLAVVTNEALAQRVRDAGARAVVLHDMAEDWSRDLDSPYDEVSLSSLGERPFLLTPLAYAHDEPLEELLEAARRLPELTFAWTGRPPAEIVAAAPNNVHFTGFVTNEDFHRLLSRCAAVMAITTEEHTMQRAGYEALNMRRPVVTSNKVVLNEFFGNSAVYAEPTADSLASAVSTVIDQSALYTQRMSELHIQKIAEQESALNTLREVLG